MNRKFYTACAAFLLIIWPLVAALGLYALGQPLPSLALLTSPRFLAMQLIVDYSMALAFVACALLFNKRTAKHANVIDELRRELAKSKDESGELRDELAKSKDESGELQDELASVRAELEETRGRLYKAENELAQTQEWLYETENVLEQTRDWVCEAEDELVRTRDQLNETKRERDGLQSKLVAVRRFARRLLAECDELRHELVEARIGFGFFQREYVDAEARGAYAQQQIKDLKSAVEARDNVIGMLLDNVVTRTKG